MKSWHTLTGLAIFGLVSALPDFRYVSKGKRSDVVNSSETITRDVVVIGGGSGGTYAATRLRELGQSVIVIEKESIMGGHTNTYSVPGTDLKIDYGVVVFHNTSIVQDYFAHYKVALADVVFQSPPSSYNVDFRTGEIVTGFTASDPSAALGAWVAQLEQYPYLASGFNLPDPIPSDFLITFGEFVAKYDLGGLVQLICSIGQGYADFLSLPALYALKFLSLELVKTIETGYVATAIHDNHALYDAATTELEGANSLLLSSSATSVQRNFDGKGNVKVEVATPTGKKIIIASKIVVAVPPRPCNFKGWDLDSKERAVFNTYINEAYYTGLITGTGLPPGTAVTNVGANTSFNLPALPGMYAFNPTAEPGLVDIKFASVHEESNENVKSQILAALGRLKIPGVTTTPKDVVFQAFSAHVPFFEHVSADQIKGGFYKRALALQGHKNTWYTGAAWEVNDSSEIWAYTETLLAGIVNA